MSKENLEHLNTFIREIPDFPKPGILFRVITPLLFIPEAREQIIVNLIEKIESFNPSVIVGIEARGFIFGAVIADRLQLPFAIVRKSGKLPAETFEVSYELEYGTDLLQIHTEPNLDNHKVILIDDLLATGGTAVAAKKLIQKANGIVSACGFIVELKDLNGRMHLGDTPICSVLEL